MEFLAIILAVAALFFAHSKQQQIDALIKRVQRLEDRRTDEATANPWERIMRPADPPPARSQAAETVEPLPTGAMEAALGLTEAEPQTPPPIPDWAITPRWAAREDEEPAVAAAEPAQQQTEAPAQPGKPQYERASAGFDMERAMGVHLPIWGGAVMLLIAGFFLARMAGDYGFFNPTLGVVACVVAAMLMLGAAVLVRWRRIASHNLIAPALASAAIGTLYATSLLATVTFGLTPLFGGFLLSAFTVALALSIASAFGRPVLIVGLLGGYLAPFFIVGASADFVIQLYLAALLVAGTATCARHGWWNLLIPMVVLHYFWLTGLVVSQSWPQVQVLMTIGLLLATPVAIFALSKRWRGVGKINPWAVHLSTALSLLLPIIGTAVHGFDPHYLTAFCAMAVVGSAMSLLGRSLYPTYATAIAWLLLLAFWRQPGEASRLMTAVVTTAAIATPLIVGLLKGQQPKRLSAILSAVMAVSFVTTMIGLNGWAGVEDYPSVWAALALVFATIAGIGAVIFGRTVPDAERDNVRGIFAAAASAYISLAIVVVVEPEFFALAAALQVLGLSLVHYRYRIAALVHTASAYTAIYFGLLAFSAIAPAVRSTGGVWDYLPGIAPWDAPIAALALPALAFIAAATVLVRAADWPLAKVLDGSGVLLLGWAASILLLPPLNIIFPNDVLFWFSLWGNALLAIGFAALFAGGWLKRDGLIVSGLLLSFGTLAAIGLNVAKPVYEFWPQWNVPGLPLLNVSLTGLVLPGAFALAIAWGLRHGDSITQVLRWTFAIAGGVLVLTGLLVDIRHLFHPYLLLGTSGPIERYTYSGVLLAMAFTALLLGTRLNSQPLRYGSLAIMLVTVGKLFMFDTGGLEGIWRVLSFIAMGIALLATGWYYGRYVFAKRAPAGETA